jgi:hypothetical protein
MHIQEQDSIVGKGRRTQGKRDNSFFSCSLCLHMHASWSNWFIGSMCLQFSEQGDVCDLYCSEHRI